MTTPDWPAVTLKLATTLDGRIATASGESQWITSEPARAETHKLRAAHDAVLVGSATALADDPELTARTDPPPDKQPVRIVADSSLRLPLDAKLFKTIDQGRVALAAGLDAADAAEDERAAAGAEIWRLAIGPMGGVSITALLARCAEERIDSIFLEGGGAFAAAFLKIGAVTRLEWFRAPKIIGGDGTACIAALGLEALDDAPRFERSAVREIGPDIWESYTRTPSDASE